MFISSAPLREVPGATIIIQKCGPGEPINYHTTNGGWSTFDTTLSTNIG